MYQHALIIHSDYSIGRRIALHRICESLADFKELRQLFAKLKSQFDHLTFSFHCIQTESSSIDSIPEYDSFFDGIQFYSDIDQFIELIKEDIKIKPIDVAKLILLKGEYSHLELQKLIYLAYCEYFRLYGEDLFSDDFQAWDLGPVIPDIYHSLKIYRDKKITKYRDSNVFPEIYSRLVKIPKYDKLINAIDLTLKKYSNSTAWELVNTTHVPDGPWDMVYNKGEGKNEIIPKELIKEYVLEHCKR